MKNSARCGVCVFISSIFTSKVFKCKHKILTKYTKGLCLCVVLCVDELYLFSAG